MKNKTVKSALLLVLAIFLFPLNAAAAGITSGSYNGSQDVYYVYMDLTGVKSFNVKHNPTGEQNSYVNGGQQDYITLNCNGSYTFTFYNSSNANMGSASVTASGIVSEPDVCKKNEPAPTEPAKTCDSCAVLNCPGWGDYMGKLDGILGAIPPAPNWNQVAATFRDTITPKIKSDMADLIGVTQPPAKVNFPSAPNAPGGAPPPSAPSKPGALNDGGITAPTGQEAPGLGDSSFSSGDLKDSATPIQERPDPSGGFSIIDPLGSLPSQQEFMDNAPNEQPFPLPSPPVGEESVDPGQDPVEPTFTEPSFTDPVITSPDIDYGQAPAPGGGTTNPTYTEPTFTDPTIDYESMPTPTAPGGASSEPTGNYNTAPIPSPYNDAPPMP